MGIQADTRTNRTVRKWAWSPSRRGLTTRSASAGRLHVIAYRATLDVPRELAQFVAKLLLAERGRRGTPEASRALTCFWQAVLGLRWARRRRTGAHHRQPQQDRRHCPRRTRPHPFRARLHQMKIAEITSVRRNAQLSRTWSPPIWSASNRRQASTVESHFRSRDSRNR